MVTFIITKMKSKEDALLELFFNSTKYWHFEELRRNVKIGKPQLARWLKKFEADGLIKRVKQKGKMPYYVQNNSDVRFRTKKRLFGLNLLYKSGLLDHLASLKADTVILFGSFSRWDWYKDSDIDIFIYGDDSDFEQWKYEKKLKREIQLFTCKNKEDLKKLGEGLLTNIIKGIVIKGYVGFVRTTVDA